MKSRKGLSFASVMEQWKLSTARLVSVDQSGCLSFDDWPLSTESACRLKNAVTFVRGLPWISEECSKRWLEDRLFCFSNGIPSQRRISIASSRLRQRLDLETWWFDLLRTVVLQCDVQSEAIVAATTTAACDAVSRAAELFCRPLIRFEISPLPHCNSLNDLEEWLSVCEGRVLEKQAKELLQCPAIFNVLVSPSLPSMGCCGESQLSERHDSNGLIEQFLHIPPGDRILFAAANRLHLLSCRDRGNSASLVNLHLSDVDRADAPVLIAADADLQLPTVVADLPDGWVPWFLEPIGGEIADPVRDPEFRSGTPGTSGISNPQTRASCPLSDPENWLLHWTRAQPGPWPGESSEEFLDALILRAASADRSAMASLLRIITDRRLLASSEGIRGRHSVVAFTEVPLREFRKRRIFRRHRHRYDFEPWGVAVRKADLQLAGARPVIYGQSSHWATLTSEEQPYFQKASTGGATNNCDEREWRIIGDVNLWQFCIESVFIFVDCKAAGDFVSRYSNWPVIVVPDEASVPKLG